MAVRPLELAAVAGSMLLLVVLLGTPLREAYFSHDDVHVALVSVANIVSAAIGVAAIYTFLQTGKFRELGLAVAFLGFVDIYLWHGFYTHAEVDFQWLIFGPASRVAFAAGLLLMLKPGTIPKQHRVPLAGSIGAVAVAVAIGAWRVGPAIGHWAASADSQQVQASRLATEALAVLLIATAWILMRRQPWANPLFSAGIVVVVFQSIFFLAGLPWTGVWWAAHGLGAVGTATLAGGVLVVARQAEREATEDRLAHEARIRQAFINHASHAIATPLTIIRLNVDALRASAPDARTRKSLDALDRATKRLTSVASQLQEAAHTTSDVEVNIQECRVAKIIDEVAAEYAKRRPDHVVNVEHPGIALQAEADPELLRDVLLRLASNAFHAGPGHATIGAAKDGRRVKIWIADRGPGIGTAEPDLVFLPFSKYSHESDAGIALAWCKRATMAMGGTLTVQNRDGGGAVFTISLPSRAVRPGRPPRKRSRAAAVAAEHPSPRADAPEATPEPSHPARR